MTADDRRLIVAGETNQVEIWNMKASEKPQFEGYLDTQAPAVYCVHVLHDCKHALLAMSGGSVQLWNIETRVMLRLVRSFAFIFSPRKRTFSGHTNTVSCLTATDDDQLLISGSLDGSIRVWNVASGKHVSTVRASSEVFTVSVVRGEDSSQWILAG